MTMQKLMKLPFSCTHAVMLGFLSLLAAFQFIAYPMLYLNTTFSHLFWIYSVIILGFILPAIFSSARINLRSFSIKALKDVCSPYCISLILITIGVAAFYLFLSIGYIYFTSDDSFYLPRAMEIISQNMLAIPHGFVWGALENSIANNVDVSTLECWKAYWSYLFRLHPTIFCRNSLSIVLPIVSWCTLYQVYKSLGSQKKNTASFCIFLLVYLSLFIEDNHSTNSAPFWILRYPSQGKSIIISIIHPALIYVCAEIINHTKTYISWQNIFLLALIFTAGIAASVIGVFWPFLCCFMTGLPYLLIKRRKDMHKLILSLIPACLPVILFAILCYFTIVTEQTHYLEFESPNWYRALSNGLNTQRLSMLAIFLMLVLAYGSSTAKLVLAGGCICHFAILVNPLLMGFVSKYLSSGAVYYRLFWITPLYYLIAYSAANTFETLSLKVQRLCALILACIIGLSSCIGIIHFGPKGFFCYVNTKFNFTSGSAVRNNPYGLDDFTYKLGQSLLENAVKDERVRVFWLSDSDCFLRQYSDRIELAGGCRNKHMIYFDQPLGSASIPPSELANEIKNKPLEEYSDPQWLYEQLIASEIDYICVDKYVSLPLAEAIPSGFELFFADYKKGILAYRVLSN